MKTDQVIHRKEERIKLTFDYNTETIKQVRKIPGARWSQTMRAWHVPDSLCSKELLKEYFEIRGRVEVAPVKKKEYTTSKTGNGSSLKACDSRKLNGNILKDYKNTLELKRLSVSTAKVYTLFFTEFLEKNRDKDVSTYKYHDIYSYIRYRAQSLNYTRKKQMIAAIKFYYEKILGWDKMFFNLSKTKDLRALPVHLGHHEIKRIISDIKSPSDRMLLILAYHINLSPKQISALKKGAAPEELVSHNPLTNNPKSCSFVEWCLNLHTSRYPNSHYLFENDGKEIAPARIRNKVYRLLGHYKLEQIYRVQAENALKESEYSEVTCKIYLSLFMRMIRDFNYTHPSLINHEEIKKYILKTREKSEHQQNSLVNMVQFFFNKVYKCNIASNYLVRPKKSFTLPNVLSQEEVVAIIESADNIKHKLLIALTYGGGLRRGEIQNLRVNDLNFEKGIIFIRNAKGKKDRYTTLSVLVKDWFKEYLQEHSPSNYLFEGAVKGTKYSFTSMANVLKSLARSVGIHRRVYLHMLRHSYATHMLETGKDIRFVQELMGHIDIKTTERYTHISNFAIRNISSPLDDLGLKGKSNRFTPGNSPPNKE